MNSQSTSAHHDQSIRRFIRRLALLLAFRESLTFVTVWCFLWGAVALVLRAASVTTRRQLLWGAIGIAIAAIAAAVVSRRRLPSRDSVRALLDSRNDCGGLLMAGADADLGVWRTPEITSPRLRWRKARAFGLLAASSAFVLISLLAPVRFAATGVARPMDVSREVENLSAQIEALKEAQVIEEAKAEALEQKLDQLGQEASGEDPAKTWEALDHLNDAVEKAAKEAAEAADARRERLARAEALAEGLMAGGDQLDSKTMTEAMRTLGEMTRKAVKENESLAGDLSPETLEAIKSGSLKAEHLKDLSKALSQSKSALNQKLSKLSKSGMINSNALKGGAQANRRDNSGLARFLKENAEKMSVDEATLQWCAGKGGVDRGRGDAAMTWTDGSSEKDARFKEKVLPPSSVAGLNDSQLVGLSASAPTADTSGVAAHGALNSAASGGGSAYTQTILPRHRGAVRRYFDRPQPK
jgi:DNA-binding transcriptional ArsR family regulator